jgi:hypothetical protein
MKTTILKLKKTGLMLFAMAVTSVGYSATYTATTSGNFSSSATWSGGIVPPSSVLLDNIIISSGVTVHLDSDLSIDGLTSQLDVEGTLNTTNNSNLTINLGTLTGDGTIVLNTININGGSTYNFTGSLTANTLNAATGFSSSANIKVKNTTNLTAGTLSIVSGGKFDTDANGVIVINGGLLSLGTGGSLGLTGNYNVSYQGGSSSSGDELTGTGLRDVTVDVGSLGTVTLNSDLTIGGTLTLTSGTLALSGNDLIINGTVATSGNGSISSTSSSDIKINSTNGTIGTLMLSGSSDDFTVNVGNNNTAHIGGSIAINGELKLTSGKLDFSNADLTINGTMSGSGSFYGTSSSNLTVNTTGGLTTGFKFANNGAMINDFTVAVGSGNSVSLSSMLTVNGDLNLLGGSKLDISDDSLVLGASSSMSGTGSIKANSASSIIINSTGGISSLTVTGSVAKMTVNSGGSNVILGNNLSINGILKLQSGTLDLNGYDLTLNGDLSSTGTGTIYSTSDSDIMISHTSSLTGGLRFDNSGNTVGKLMIDIDNNGYVRIEDNDLYIDDSLRFMSGKLNIGDNSLIMSATAGVKGAGNNSYVITEANGYLQMALTAGTSDSSRFHVGTIDHYAPANIRLSAISSNGNVKVNVVKNVMAQGTSGTDLSATESMVDATWNIESDIIVNLNMDIQVMWKSSMEVHGFNRHKAYLSHYHNSYWDTVTTSNSVSANGMFSITRTGLTSLSPFAVFDKNTATAVIASQNNSLFEVYPNPAVENITIKNGAASAESMNVEIYNSNGRLVANYKMNGLTSTIPVNSLESGSYFIKVYNDQVSAIKRFTKF